MHGDNNNNKSKEKGNTVDYGGDVGHDER